MPGFDEIREKARREKAADLLRWSLEHAPASIEHAPNANVVMLGRLVVAIEELETVIRDAGGLTRGR